LLVEVAMSKKVLLATEKAFAAKARDQVVDILKKASCEVVLLENYTEKSALLNAVADVDAVIIRSDIVDADVLAAAKNLALVVRAGAGFDNVDCKAARAKGVDVMNTPGQNANAVAELAFGLMLNIARAKYSGKTGFELRGKSIGIHAIGAVGRAVATIAKGFGMTVRAFDPFVPDDAIRAAGAEPLKNVEDLYRLSDYVSLHIPATAETKGSIGTKLLSLMPKNGCLVNTARKEVINEAELLKVFETRTDLKYVADIAPDAATLAALNEKYADRVFFTSKKSGAQTNEANVNAGLAAARQIVDYFDNGVKKFIVNP
jgi:D-3-phosphoglycerate dehydrogenase